MQKFISYLRVSTDKQSTSGLGIESQRSAVHTYVGTGEILSEYVETESGTRDDRPELAKALEHARAANATLIVAKLDRLGRRAAHVLSLLDSAGVPVVFADSPNAGALELGVRAVVAQEEARAISERTRAALRAAKTRGVKLGGPLGSKPLVDYIRANGNTAGVEGAKKAADEFAERLRFAVERLTAEGNTTSQAISDSLNASGFPTRRGGQWTRGQVARLVKRLKLNKTPVETFKGA